MTRQTKSPQKNKQKSQKKQKKSTDKSAPGMWSLGFYRFLALISLCLLLVCFFIYGVTRAPEQRTLALLIFALPLALPIRGTLLGRAYTFGYGSLMASVYFLLASSLYIFHLDWARYVMLVAATAALLWFFACLVHNKKIKTARRQSSK
ncbi:DUF2069 domain-containing protein [Ostreibacterium oceani]|nr:DUF2069 domain-containing protein [Ostreibacterium oceani]